MMTRTPLKFLPALLALGLLCSAASGSQPGPGASASPMESHAYQEAFDLYASGKYDPSLQKLSEFEKAFPQSPLIGQVENLHGLAFLAMKRDADAVQHFQKALDAGQGNPGFGQYILYNLATAQFEGGQVDDAQKTLLRIRLDDMDSENRLKTRYLKCRVALKRGQPLDSAVECLEGSRLMSSAGAGGGQSLSQASSQSKDTRNAFSLVLDQSLDRVTDPAQLEELYRDFEDSPLADQVLYRLATVEAAAGAKDKAENHARLLMSRFPDSPLYARANEIAHGSAPAGATAAGSQTGASPAQVDRGPVDAKAIGVLLPMKGKFARFGSRSLQGIEMALGMFGTGEPDSKLTLVIEDSGEETETALKALNRLVTQRHVVAVIGPLLSKGIDQVTERAQELGVPLVSLARHAGTPSDWIFQGGLTLRLQAYEIARYAIESLGMHRFAMLYPRDKVGEESSQRFWDAVEELGGTIVGSEAYNPGETDFRHQIDKLSGLYYTEARAPELEMLAKARETNKVKKRTRRTEQFYSLKPIVDYDAVFIPDEPKVAGQILPTFAYRDVDHVKFLGTSAWNSPEFLARVQGYADSSLFLDAFYPESASPVTRGFVAKYHETFSQDPGAMEALAYDAAKVLQSALEKGGTDGLTRADLRDRLKSTQGLAGVTGKISYSDGYLNRDLKILTAKQGRIIEAALEPEKAPTRQ